MAQKQKKLCITELRDISIWTRGQLTPLLHEVQAGLGVVKALGLKPMMLLGLGMRLPVKAHGTYQGVSAVMAIKLR